MSVDLKMGQKFSFEIVDKDIAARICRLDINGKKIETPILMPVYNPNKPLISIKELQDKFKSKIIMTNSYIILKNEALRENVLNQGIHRFLNFDGIVATDSGSYQLMEYGSVETTNKDIIEFQEKIGTDIGSFLDIPSLPDSYKPRAAEQLDITLQRAKEAINAKFLVNAGIQGSTYLDLRERAAKEIGKDFNIVAIGGIVPLMESYRFSKLVDIIITVKKNIPSNRVVHGFGLGHPMIFSLAISLGCDVFDSAAYAIFAQDNRYMTENSTKKLSELEYLPCNCPVCTKYDLELKELENEERVKQLATHNLYVSLEELNRVKQAIKENRLWEFISSRFRSHPMLLACFKMLKENAEWLSEYDSITKNSAFFYTGPESESRPEVINAKKRSEGVNSANRTEIYPFGSVPIEILDVYPFGSAVLLDEIEKPKQNVRDLFKIKGIMDYQFGSGAGDLIDNNVRIVRSRKTKRIRWIYSNKELIASVRAKDHFIIPKYSLAEKLLKKFKYPRLRIVIEDDAVPFVREGKSVFNKFVIDVDPELRCNDEVLIVDKNDSLLNIGTLVLAPKEIKDFKRGVAARVR